MHPVDCVARRSYIQILFTSRALPDGRLDAQESAFILAQTLSRAPPFGCVGQATSP